MGHLITNATLVDIAPRHVRSGSLLVEGDSILAVCEGSPPDTWKIDGHETLDADGALVMPGNVCAHTHLYSVLARGMPPPPRSPRNFPEILEYIWWRLDRALDEPSIRCSGLIGAIDALKAGTTTLVDHHASPSCIEGSLDMLAEEMSSAGVRGVLCYEVTDRNGPDGRDEGLRENERFAREARGRYAGMRALFGAHASFTLDDSTLERVAGTARDLGIGVHIHVAEDACDQEDSGRRSGERVGRRLDGFGIIGSDAVLAHGVHLDDEEIRLIGNRRSWLAHNCRSNLNNGVGRAPMPALLRELSGRLVLGTDGIDQDMFSESRTAYFRAREQTLEAFAEQYLEALANGAKLVGETFGKPLGRLQPGYLADLVVYDYTPPTPLTAGNLAWHWEFAFTGSLVKHVMVNGEWVVRDRSMVKVDGGEARAVARKEAQKLWRRMEALPV